MANADYIPNNDPGAAAALIAAADAIQGRTKMAFDTTNLQSTDTRNSYHTHATETFYCAPGEGHFYTAGDLRPGMGLTTIMGHGYYVAAVEPDRENTHIVLTAFPLFPREASPVIKSRIRKEVPVCADYVDMNNWGLEKRLMALTAKAR